MNTPTCIFDKMQKLSEDIIKLLDVFASKAGVEAKLLEHYPWQNHIYRDQNFRRAHVEVLDVREAKKMWIMHICIFPHLDDSSPIFGFDVICGANKITGVFLDFSPSGDINHPMIEWFKEHTSTLTWKKERELPDWGKRIFGPHMIAAGGVNTDEELDKIIDAAMTCIKYYIANVGKTIHNANFVSEHNHYYKNQKENIHTKRFLINCGYSEEDVTNFINRHLFPEIKP